MYIHTFLFQWQPSVTTEMKDRAAREIHALQGQIPGLLEPAYGANISPHSQGFTHVRHEIPGQSRVGCVLAAPGTPEAR